MSVIIIVGLITFFIAIVFFGNHSLEGGNDEL